VELLLDHAAASQAFRAWWCRAVRAQAMAALQAMGFNAEDCGVALDAAVGAGCSGSSTHACVERACELLVEAAEHKAEPAARGAAEAPRRRSPRRSAGCDLEPEPEIAASAEGCDLEPEPEIAAPAEGNYYVGDADCSLADSESSRDDY